MDDKKKVKKPTTAGKDAPPAKPPGTPPTKRPASAKKPAAVSKDAPPSPKPSPSVVKKVKKEGTATKETTTKKDKDSTKEPKKVKKDSTKDGTKVTTKLKKVPSKEKKKKKEEIEHHEPEVHESDGEDSGHAEDKDDGDEGNHVTARTPTPPHEEPTTANTTTTTTNATPITVETNHVDTTPKDPKTRLSTLLDDCEDNTELLLDLYKIFSDYLKQKGVLPPTETPTHTDSHTDQQNDPLLQLYSSYHPRRTSNGGPLTLSLDGLNLSSLDTTPAIRDLSAKDKQALLSKALERIKAIKDRNMHSSGGMSPTRDEVNGLGLSGLGLGGSDAMLSTI